MPAKPKKQKTTTLRRMFGFDSKRLFVFFFLVVFFLFFFWGFQKLNTKKNLESFFVFFHPLFCIRTINQYLKKTKTTQCFFFVCFCFCCYGLIWFQKPKGKQTLSFLFCAYMLSTNISKKQKQLNVFFCFLLLLLFFDMVSNAKHQEKH